MTFNVNFCGKKKHHKLYKIFRKCKYKLRLFTVFVAVALALKNPLENATFKFSTFDGDTSNGGKGNSGRILSFNFRHTDSKIS